MPGELLIDGPIGVHPSDSLWRYVRLSTFFEYLVGRAYIPSVRKLRDCDPTEGLPLVDHVWAMNGFKNEEADALDDWVYQHRLNDDEKTCWDLNRTCPGANQRVWLQHYFEVLERSRFAWCWLRSANESAAMWQLYGNEGVAIRSNRQKLAAQLTAGGRKWLVSGIKYLDRNQPAWTEFGWGDEKANPWIRRPFLIKRAEYAHEHEVRFITASEDGCEGITLSGLEPADWIDEIVFCPRLPDSECGSLIAAVERICPALKSRARQSRLFQRDPTSTLSREFEEALDGLVARNCQAAATNWPPVLREL